MLSYLLAMLWFIVLSEYKFQLRQFLLDAGHISLQSFDFVIDDLLFRVQEVSNCEGLVLGEPVDIFFADAVADVGLNACVFSFFFLSKVRDEEQVVPLVVVNLGVVPERCIGRPFNGFFINATNEALVHAVLTVPFLRSS